MGRPVIRWITKNGRRIPIRASSTRYNPDLTWIKEALSPRTAFYSSQPSEPQTQTASQFFKGMGESILIKALAVGASATIPGAGAVIVPLYAAWSYASIGMGAYSLYSTWQKNKEARNIRLAQFAAGVADTTLGGSEERLADYIVTNIQKTGAIAEAANETGVNPAVYSDMLKESVTSALSCGFQEFAKLSIGKLVAA